MKYSYIITKNYPGCETSIIGTSASYNGAKSLANDYLSRFGNNGPFVWEKYCDGLWAITRHEIIYRISRNENDYRYWSKNGNKHN